MKTYLGLSAGYHDAAASVVTDQGDILFAGHAERYSKVKHDAELNGKLVCNALDYANGVERVSFYEKPWNRYTRQVFSGQSKWPTKSDFSIKPMLGEFGYKPNMVQYFNHHKSHAAAAFQTSLFSEATCVVIDAVGEWDTISIWDAHYDKKGNAQYKRVWRKMYPHSIGLLYSAFTERLGFCLLYTSPSPRDRTRSRMPSSA